MNEAVDIRLAEGLPGGLDDVLTDSDRCPRAQAVGGLDEHAYRRIRAVTLLKDADFVVDDLKLLDGKVGRQQRIA